MFKVFAISLVLSIIGGLVLSAVASLFALGIGTVLVGAVALAFAISFLYTFPAAHAILTKGTGTSTGGGDSKVS